MIVVLSMNTALDRIVEIPNFTAGSVYRATRAGRFAGGKALNVARVVRQLERPVRVVGTLGGLLEPYIRAWCHEMGIDARWVHVEGETRTCVTVVDPHAKGQTVLNEPGPELTAEDVRTTSDALEAATDTGDILCISGSAPPGVPGELYADIVRRLRARGVRVLVDASGPALEHALYAQPWTATPNEAECAELFGAEHSREELLRRAMHRIDHCLLTLGADGVLYGDVDGVWRVMPPRVRAVNAVGSGDALVAGFVVGVADGAPVLDAVRLGVACGASNASRFEPGIGSRGEVETLASRVEVAARP